MVLPKAIIILSGGLDSTVSFYEALKSYGVVLALTFDYGQRAFLREKQAALQICEKEKISHKIISIPWLSELGNSALNRRNIELPRLEESNLSNLEKTRVSARAVWIPNRNGLFLNIAACYAEDLKAEIILTGFNQEEATTFPDNSAQFVEAINQSLFYSTSNHSRVRSLTLSMNKEQIVKRGLELQIPFEWIWSCYEGNEKMCGVCESCLRLKRGFQKNEVLERFKGIFLN